MLIKSTSEMIVEMIPPSQRDNFKCNACNARVSVKYKLTNPVTKETRCFCNMCYMRVMISMQRANEMLEDSFYNLPTFIRFGEIPEDKISTIYYRGEVAGKEKGLSVYYGTQIDGRWHVVLPNPSYESTNNGIQDFLGGQGPGAPDPKRKIYLVTGQLVDFGSDGEPVITRVRILEDLTGKFIYDDKTDKGYEAAVKAGLVEPKAKPEQPVVDVTTETG